MPLVRLKGNYIVAWLEKEKRKQAREDTAKPHARGIREHTVAGETDNSAHDIEISLHTGTGKPARSNEDSVPCQITDGYTFLN